MGLSMLFKVMIYEQLVLLFVCVSVSKVVYCVSEKVSRLKQFSERLHSNNETM